MRKNKKSKGKADKRGGKEQWITIITQQKGGKWKNFIRGDMGGRRGSGVGEAPGGREEERRGGDAGGGGAPDVLQEPGGSARGEEGEAHPALPQLPRTSRLSLTAKSKSG